MYGIGAMLQGGLQGWETGQENLHKEARRPQELERADLQNEEAATVNRIGNIKADRLEDLVETDDKFKQAMQQYMNEADPGFSDETNFNAAGLKAAKATGNPELVSKYVTAHDVSSKKDLFSETVAVLNDAKNATGAIDFTKVNDMYRRKGIPIEILRVNGDEVVVEGHGGVKTYNIQGFINELSRGLNPNVPYGNVQEQIRSETAQVQDAKVAARTGAYDQAIEEQKHARAKELKEAELASAQKVAGINQAGLASRSLESQATAAKASKYVQDRLDQRAARPIAPSPSSQVAADRYAILASRGMDKAAIIRILKSEGYDQDQVLAAIPK